MSLLDHHYISSINILTWGSYRDGGEETFWDVGDDDADEEDDGIEPVVSEDEGDDEEGDTEEDGHSCDEVDEVGDFFGDGRLTHLDAGCEVGDPTHHCPIARVHNNSEGRTWQRWRMLCLCSLFTNHLWWQGLTDVSSLGGGGSELNPRSLYWLLDLVEWLTYGVYFLTYL